MKINYLRIAKIVVFVFFIGAVLTLTGKIVGVKYILDTLPTIVDGFYAEDKDSMDVIIMGSSNSFCTVDPIVLYDEYGITAYDFGSSSQQMNMAYLYMKEALKTQSPKLIAFEVNYLVGDTLDYENTSALRWGYTCMPLTVDKIKSIYNSTGGFNADFVSYVFPIFFYHTRWNELSKTDFTYFYSDKTSYTKGYDPSETVCDENVFLEGYGMLGESYVDDENMEYFDKMVELCRENNVELLLFKSPREQWHQYDTQAVYEIANEKNLKFIDYNELYYNGELDLDTKNDFRDSTHLNDSGAAKVTYHLGSYIKENYDIPDRRGSDTLNSWDEASRYRQRSGIQEFMSAANVYDCLEMIQNDENYVIIVSKKEKSDIIQWVYEDCKVKENINWTDDGMVHMNIGNNTELVLAKSDRLAQVVIDGTDYYQYGYKWNVVVYDKILDEVVADVCYTE